MIPLPIDKQYLISSLKDFDEKILSKKYNKNSEINKPGITEISQSFGNAIEEKEDGLYVPDLSTDLDAIETQVDMIKKHQKYLNTELEWGVFGVTGRDYDAGKYGYIYLHKNDPIPFDILRQGNIEYDFSNHSVKLKAGKVYRLYVRLFGAYKSDDPKNEYYGYWSFKNITTGEIIKCNDETITTYGDKYINMEFIYQPKDDCDVIVYCQLEGSIGEAALNSGYYDPVEEIYVDIPEFIVTEVGRAIEIDPVQYANDDSGIEDSPVGEIISLMGKVAPKHYLACDGAKYNIEDYPYLAEYFKEQFGAYNHFGGNGVDTFAVPNLQGEFLRGAGENGHDNQGSGAEVGEHQDGTEHPNYFVVGGSGNSSFAWITGADQNAIVKKDDSFKASVDNLYGSVVSSLSNDGNVKKESFTSRPTNTSVLYCIKAEPTYYLQINGGDGVKDIDEVIEKLNEKDYLGGLATEEKVKEDIDAHTEAMKEDIRNGYQKILNEAITSCNYTISALNGVLNTGDILTFKNIENYSYYFKRSNGIELDEDGYIKLKSGHTYCIHPTIMGVGSLVNIGYFIINKDGINIENNELVTSKTNPFHWSESGSLYSESIFPIIYTPEKDCSIAIKIGTYNGGNLYQYSMTIFELKQPVFTNVNVASYADQVGQGEDTPVGEVISFMGTKAPENYLACDGAEYNIGDYPDLEEFFASQFGTVNHFGGDGTTTFTVPDLRGEFLRGTGENSHVGQGNGAEVGEHRDGTILNPIEANSDQVWLGTMSSLIRHDEGVGNADTVNMANNFTSISCSKINNSTSSTTITTRPTNTSVMYCIKAFRTFSMKLDEAKIYSEDERVVGKWIDGKILYQKVIKTALGEIGGYGDFSIPMNVDNMDFGFIDKAFVINESDVFNSTSQLPINGIYCYMDRDNYNIMLSITNAISTPIIVKYKFVICYTKK